MKQHRVTISCLILIPILLSAYWFSYSQVFELRQQAKLKNRITAPLVPPTVMKMLAGEFKGIVADFLLLEVQAFIDGYREDITPEDWNKVHLHLSQAMVLDPYFMQTYTCAQAYLPWDAQKVHEAIDLLKISKEHRTWDWYPGYYISFNYFFFLKDNLTASQYLMETSRMPGAPPLLATLGARLSQKAGQTQAAIAFLQTMYEEAEDEGAREILALRIKALTGVLILEKGIEQFKARFGRAPKVLEELVTAGTLRQLPKNPYENKTYTYKNGRIEF